MREECKQFRGRKRDLCEGRGFDGRKHPEQQHSDRLRLKHGLDRIEVAVGDPDKVKSRDDLKRMTVSSIGTNLSRMIPCGDCRVEIARLNTMTIAEVIDDIDAISEAIVRNARRNAPWWLKLSIKTLDVIKSELHSEYIKSCIKEACEMEAISGTQQSE
jgi:type VI protein secretion system component VasA